jgi:hypothetical protein
MLVPLMFIELINISLPIKNTEPSSACVSLLRLVKPIIKSENCLEVNTLSVFNKSIQFDGYQNTFVKLMELGIRECGWLPFQKNIRNDNTGIIRKTVCAPVFDMLVPLMFIELMNISLPIKNTEPSSACVSLLRLVKPIYSINQYSLMVIRILLLNLWS